MKLLTILGARPQFIKAAVVSRALEDAPEIEERIVHTGQHFDANMSDVFFEQMQIPRPRYNLGVHGQSHGVMTGRMLADLDGILAEERPDWVLVYGDTNSTLAGALAAKQRNIRLAHVEAGLRSFNMRMPEEINRVVTDRISDLLFCPTTLAVRNLEQESPAGGFREIVRTGDVMYDALLHYSKLSGLRSNILEELGLGDFVLATVHRQENTDDVQRLRSIVRALDRISAHTPVVLPVHPRTRQVLDREGIRPAFRLIAPVGYFEILELLKSCRMVLTDSGGMQKEAFFCGKHCVTLRDETEWQELVDHGFNILAGADEERIWRAFEALSTKRSCFDVDLYGEGDASRRIVERLRRSESCLHRKLPIR